MFCSKDVWIIDQPVIATGAAGLGVASTFILPTTLEDLLAVAIGGVIAYAALLNLPLKRNDAKEKIERVALNFSQVNFKILGSQI